MGFGFFLVFYVSLDLSSVEGRLGSWGSFFCGFVYSFYFRKFVTFFIVMFFVVFSVVLVLVVELIDMGESVVLGGCGVFVGRK